MICKNFHGLAFNESETQYRIARLGCGKWSCPACSQRLASKWRARVINAVNEIGGLWTWFTITAHGKMRGGYNSITNLRNGWDKLIKRMKRKFGKFCYVRVFEQHKDGSFHIHAIANFHFNDIRIRVSKKDKSETKYSYWLQQNCKKLGMGLYTHADDIESGKHAGYVASYVTKYMTKMSGDFVKFIGRVRRIQPSQNFPKLPNKKVEKWEFRRDLSIGAASEISRAGKNIVDITTGETVDGGYFERDNVYLYPETANDSFVEYVKRVNPAMLDDPDALGVSNKLDIL